MYVLNLNFSILFSTPLVVFVSRHDRCNNKQNTLIRDHRLSTAVLRASGIPHSNKISYIVRLFRLASSNLVWFPIKPKGTAFQRKILICSAFCLMGDPSFPFSGDLPGKALWESMRCASTRSDED